MFCHHIGILRDSISEHCIQNDSVTGVVVSDSKTEGGHKRETDFFKISVLNELLFTGQANFQILTISLARQPLMSREGLACNTEYVIVAHFITTLPLGASVLKNHNE